jgi:hypothetical protein
MLEEVDTYCLLALENNQYKEVEDTYLWLFNHSKLQPELRIKYGCRIYFIDEYYIPKIA